MKKWIAFLLAASMVFAMVACGGNTTNNAGTNNGGTNNSSTGDEGSAASGETVKIGLVTAVTGSNSLVGEEAQEGAQLAIDEINAAGGVNGQQLEIVVTDEVDPASLDIRTLLNGEVVQQSNTSLLITSVPEIIAFITASMTLEPGDVIATGTPAGVGPMHPGDTVEVEIQGIGTLRSRIV